MASKEKVKRKKEKGHRLSFGRKKSKTSTKSQLSYPDEEDVTGSQVSVRSASKENIKDNTGQDPGTRHEDVQIPHPVPDRPKSNTSETRKTKSDHIDQKLGSTGDLKPGDSERRASSPNFRKNVIIPTADVAKSTLGSAVSLRSNLSHSSLKEAWVEQTEIRKVEADEDSPEKHAYIPYLYARNCIAKIMEDMKQQKSNHIVIVENIQTHYTTIEDETQQQFNMFVLCMRQDYQEKRKAFRQIMDVHKVELEEKERYWNEMLTSLAERNNKLLREKKVILTTSKTEIEKLEKENAKITKDFTEKMDKMALAPLPVPAEKKKWEEERKILHEQLETEKAKVVQLEEEIMNTPITPGVSRLETATVEAKESSAGPSGGIVAAGAIAMTNKNNRELEKERREMEGERAQLDEERRKFGEEREGFGDERKKWLDEINRLQVQLGDKEMADSEWKTKYETVKDRLDESAQTQAKYLLLQSQYEALAALVKDSDTSNAVQEQLEKTKGEKMMMAEEKKNMERDIEKWEKDFEKKNKRKPTEDDMTDSVKEMYTSHSELEYMVTSLEKKEETLAKVDSGKIPDPPEVVPVPIDTKDPEIVTVQVKVPDPEIVKELEKSHEEIALVQTEVTALQETISSLKTQISQQNSDLAQQRSRIAELDAQLATVQAGGGVVAPLGLPGSTVSDEELEALKKENRELRKDMKKMIKQYQRMADRKKELGEDEDQTEHDKEVDQQLGDLDNKIADLESENEALKEERTLLKERVRTITETITITQTHGDTDKKLLQDKDNTIDELRQELEKKKLEIIAIHKDMKKMIKSHEKLRVKADDLAGSEKAVKMLEIVAMLIHEIHGEVPDAARKVNVKLEEYETQMAIVTQVLESKQQAYAQWADRYLKKNGAEPLKTDRPQTPQLEKTVLIKMYKGDKEGTQLHDSWESTKKDYKEKALHYAAIQLIKTGDVTKIVDKEGTVTTKDELEVDHLEKQLQSADNKLIEIESEKETIKLHTEKLQQQNKDLEEQIDSMRKQLEMQAAVMTDTESSADLTQQLGELQKKTDQFETELMQEKLAHVNTREELESLRKQFVVAMDEANNEKEEIAAKIATEKLSQEAEKEALNDEIAALKGRTEALEEERLSNMPPDTAQEIRELQEKLKILEQEKSSSRTSSVTLNAQIAEFRTKLDVCTKNLETQRALNRELEAKVKSGRLDKEKEAKKMSRHMEEKENKRAKEDKQRINMLVKRVKELEAKAGKGMAVVAAGAAGGEIGGPQAAAMKRELQDQAARIKQLEAELKHAEKTGLTGAISADKSKGKQEKILKELEKKMTWEKDKADKLMEGLKEADDENKTLKKKVDEKEKDLVKVKGELKALSIAAKDGVEAAAKVKTLEAENKKMGEENAVLTKNFESERVLRKKYYNMVEDMKGKIRVYCRSRPLSSDELARGNKAVVKSVDEYSISVSSQRGVKEFQYDQVFMEDSTQEKIFEDTNNLIQSAVDGYNVCIFAYGQTGSGKTFTMIGDRDQKYPGIAPRAFNRIFELIHELRNKFKITVQAYMLELYNDKLIDLFAKPGTSDDDYAAQSEKLEIKKDKKGLVYIQGAVVKDARNAKELFALFEEGSINRHTASTKMNAESSRSHLVIGIVMEATNKNTGNITKGKLSLVDLAGSERVGKTGATADQLKEAMSINKSLSALGDVISALSSEQQFIPYRNHKLTMLMQDSLGGNAKTLMFVNISPADYNCDETVISLTYASRVKLITNDASKNADNKEIARLKMVIEKMRKGEQVEEDQ